MVIVEAGVFPSFAKEGWTRPKEDAAKHPLKGADGVVVSSYRLFIPTCFDNRWLETTTPSAPLRNEAIFFMAQPPLLREGGEFSALKQPFEQRPRHLFKRPLSACSKY
jgi:hypothetical protein